MRPLPIPIRPKFHWSGKEVYPAKATVVIGKIAFEFPIRAAARGSNSARSPATTGSGDQGADHGLRRARRADETIRLSAVTKPKETHMSDMTEKSAGATIRPFHVNVPDAELTELRRRINTTKWPERETVTDASQGVQLATSQALARYWQTEYDWRKVEARLNALPQFVTEIDGLDIHFIHVRSKHDDALPLIVTHGCPGSVIEQLKIVDPLTNPTAHGASASDAFHLVIPSILGFGFSGKPTTTGWGPDRIARAWTELMKPPRIHAICGTRRRLGSAYHGSDGAAGASGTGRHPHQHAWSDSTRH